MVAIPVGRLQVYLYIARPHHTGKAKFRIKEVGAGMQQIVYADVNDFDGFASVTDKMVRGIEVMFPNVMQQELHILLALV